MNQRTADKHGELSPAEKLRDFLTDPECHVADDIPDDIWLPFCESLRAPRPPTTAPRVTEFSICKHCGADLEAHETAQPSATRPSYRNIAVAAATKLRTIDRTSGDEVMRLVEVADKSAPTDEGTKP